LRTKRDKIVKQKAICGEESDITKDALKML